MTLAIEIVVGHFNDSKIILTGWGLFWLIILFGTIAGSGR